MSFRVLVDILKQKSTNHSKQVTCRLMLGKEKREKIPFFVNILVDTFVSTTSF